MQKYITKSGDCFDSIAFNFFGDSRFVEDLINANRDYLTTFIFSAGIELNIPDVDKTSKTKTPPWKNYWLVGSC